MNRRIKELAARSPNFGFLLTHEPLLVLYGSAAEAAIFADPETAVSDARQFSEVLASELTRRGRVKVEGERHIDRLRALAREGYLRGDIADSFERIRMLDNERMSGELADKGARAQQTAFQAVHTAFRLGVWFHRLVTGDRSQIPFVPPQPPEQSGDSSDLAALHGEFQRAREALAEARLTYERKVSSLQVEQEARQTAEVELAKAHADHSELIQLIATMRNELTELRRRLDESQKPTTTVEEREELLANAVHAAREPLTEVQVRVQLDRMLRAAGWSIQDPGPGLDLYAGQGVAVREVTTQAGRADYFLYADRKLVGVIEAKREGEDLSAAESQADRYAASLTAGQRLASWRPELPFRYASDGGETRFRNTLDPDSRSREIFSFHRPETLSWWMDQADEDPQAPTYRARLRLRLPELQTRHLRPAQIEAICGLEKSLARDHPRALIQMATGAGKTFTAVTFSYRLLKYAKAGRILFLVDRNNLGTQARSEFENYATPDDGRKFSDLYNVQQLTGSDMLASSKVVISTIQRLYLALAGKKLPSIDDNNPELDSYETNDELDVSYNSAFPPETFSLIIVDECHRSIYGKWRSVLEYFDAHVVGLTATPVAQTTGFFHGNLVSEYTYEQAVADNVNVDFDVYEIETDISKNGALIRAGTIVPVRDRRTRRQRYQDLDDDLAYTGTDVGGRVISYGQMRSVIQTFHDRLFTEIFPERAKIPTDRRMIPKTLIFAKNDEHAEEIVKIVRETFGRGNEFCAKITHKARRAHELLAAFRNSPVLRIAVTVDMIATGTDVKALECLIFMRDVRSWAYFEQMKGRGARTIPLAEFQNVTPDIGEKTRFVIVDAIGVTRNPKLDAAPLDRDPTKRVSLEKLLSKVAAGTIDENDVSTLASRLTRLNKDMTPEQQQEIEHVAGEPLSAIISRMVHALSIDVQEEAKLRHGQDAVRELALRSVEPLARNRDIRVRLLEIRRALDIIFDEVNADAVLRAAPVINIESAEETLAHWRGYLKEHRDEFSDWHELYERTDASPREVYDQLKGIAQRIARPPRSWTPERLWKAYETLGQAQSHKGVKSGIGDLVSLIRLELGLDKQARPYQAIIEEKFAAWLARHEETGTSFESSQRWWLENIAQVTAETVRFDAADLDHPPFAIRNGTDGFLAVFGDDRAVAILNELNQELII